MAESKNRVQVLPPIPTDFSFKNLRKSEVARRSPEQEPPQCSSMEESKSRLHVRSARPKKFYFKHLRNIEIGGPIPLPELPQSSPTRLSRLEKPQVDRPVFPGEAAKVSPQPSPKPPPLSAPTYAPNIAPAIAHTIAPSVAPAFPYLHGNHQQAQHGTSAPARHTHMGLGVPMIPDPQFGTDKIMGVNLYNFHSFTMGKEKALVLFYNQTSPANCRIKQQFELAAERYQDQKHAFGAVDCFLDKELCCRERICNTPMYKLYSNGFNVSSISDTSKFNAYQMHLLVNMTPVFAQPRNITTKQPARPRVIMGTRMLKRQHYGV